MPRIAIASAEEVSAAARPLLDGVQKTIGFVPNLFQTLAHAPSVLSGYLQLSQTLSRGTLGAREREQIALAVSELNGCDYCLAAHGYFSAKAGLSDGEIQAARAGELDALTRVARQVAENRGALDEAQLAAARTAGISDAKLIEVVAQVALMTLTNYLNNLAHTDVDFPPAQ
ncbi:carboxymuconolactone decarboxylase family protein [Pseudomonas sp. BN415]|uniref:carboxymuconolactone decarboxylase family protein n=1 Tax=Pseudomonas sp. BN415 TaxID=2567889 RepID=UPI0024577825|nr:carboxymuconolactone decarboxylase family protein [Pseudomonas sp. BN415]MDH4583194.1 carboxymuconolactone decarboxylase family protein [Pseudomonas sp. BN415]